MLGASMAAHDVAPHFGDHFSLRPSGLKRTKCWLATWTVFFSVSIAISGLQCYEFINRFLSDPSETLIVVLRNESMTPPSVTICPMPGSDQAAEERLFAWLNVTSYEQPDGRVTTDLTNVLQQILYDRNVSVSRALARIAYKPEDVVSSCAISEFSCTPGRSEGGNWKFQWYDTLNFQSHTICFTFQPNVTLGIGMESSIALTLRIPQKSYTSNLTGKLLLSPSKMSALGWYVYFHDSNVKVTELDRITYVPSTFVEPSSSGNSTLFVQFSPTQFKFLNRENRPCSDEPGYVYEKCVEDCILSSDYFPCHFPWPGSSGNQSRVTKPACLNRTEYTDYSKAFNKMRINYRKQLTSLMKTCDCPQRCSSIRYRAEFVRLRTSSSDENVIQGPKTEQQGNSSTSINDTTQPTNDPRIRIRGYFPSSEVESFTEMRSYDLVQMLGEMGGSLGLFLGVSVLSVLGVAESVSDAFRRLTKSRRAASRSKDKEIRSAAEDLTTFATHTDDVTQFGRETAGFGGDERAIPFRP